MLFRRFFVYNGTVLKGDIPAPKNCLKYFQKGIDKPYYIWYYMYVKRTESLETKGEQTMIINGKEMTAKEFAMNYIPTPEEFSIRTRVEI